MEIIKSNPLGFCAGVANTVSKITKLLLANKAKKIYCYNYPVHNDFVNAELKKLGLNIVNKLSLIKQKGILVISAHGVAPEIIYDAKKMGMEIFDTTCKKVLYAQNIAKDMQKKGLEMFIFGDDTHVEVKGIIGSCDYDMRAIQKKPEDLAKKKIGLIAQTTQNKNDFLNLKKEMAKDAKALEFVDTICLATQKRQQAALNTAKKADLMLVIGDKKSANTKRLLEICQAITPSFFIASKSDLKKIKDLQKINRVGITAGASTPKNIIEEIIVFLKSNYRAY